MNKEPYISFVTISRNDGYGGGIERFQFCFDHLYNQLEKHQLPSEIIIVEWNPPEDRPSLSEAMIWPEESQFCTVRLITVAKEIHQKYKGWEKKVFHVAAAFNVGIRRAQGRFILPKASDALYSSSIIPFIAKQKLKEKTLYRVIRYDIDENCYPETIKAQTESLREKIFAENITYINERLPLDPIFDDLPQLEMNAAGDFQLMSKKDWHHLHGQFETDDVNSFRTDGYTGFAAAAAGFEEIVLPKEQFKLFKFSHSQLTRSEKRLNMPTPFEKIANKIPWPLRPILFRLYRLIHGYTPDVRRKIVLKDYTYDSFFDFLLECREIVSGKKSYQLNDNDLWGCNQEKLDEKTVCSIQID
ncbi:glycosyltransferase family 2 protein [Magnetococcales bacterium HHB-1]